MWIIVLCAFTAHTHEVASSYILIGHWQLTETPHLTRIKIHHTFLVALPTGRGPPMFLLHHPRIRCPMKWTTVISGFPPETYDKSNSKKIQSFVLWIQIFCGKNNLHPSPASAGPSWNSKRWISVSEAEGFSGTYHVRWSLNPARRKKTNGEE